ncbi:hypothetical protein HDU91_001902 [Kappamyces sp. JEL0680]|nr:hypothetical protein HDU91_001902 [Kappamyces sp. JEL0680]
MQEGSTMERFLCFDLEKMNALCLDFYPAKDNANAMLIYGTDSGNVNVFSFSEDRLLQVATRQKGQVDTIYLEKEPASPKLKQIGTVWKRRAHQDWVSMVKYIPELRLLVSVSPDSKDSFVVARFGNNHQWEFHSFSIQKGVNCFTFGIFPPTIATGGTDKKIRFWNPHRLSHPTATLKGHAAPVVDMTMNQVLGHVISLCSDKQVKIWDIRNQTCLQSIFNSIRQYPDNILSSVLFSIEDDGGAIITASNTLFKYRLKRNLKLVSQTKSHDYSVRKILYNAPYKQIVSGCDGGTVNVWDVANGQKVFKFSQTQDSCEITAMTFDAQSRRLITGARDGTVRIWNHNNGALLQELVTDDCAEITGIEYISMKNISYILVTGWNRKISLFLDDTPELYRIHPKFEWPDSATPNERLPWHSDDILSMAFCPPSSLATSSYNGDIILCNLNSGQISHHFNPHDLQRIDYACQLKSIDKLLFLVSRASNLKAAHLLSAGGDGIIRFWHIWSGKCYFQKECSTKLEPIYAMAASDNECVLAVGDAGGYVSLWDIAKAGLENDNDFESAAVGRMPMIRRFKAHTAVITDIQFAGNRIVSSSTDSTVRIFTLDGSYLGTFGQNQAWDLDTVDRKSHPPDIRIEDEEVDDKGSQLLQSLSTEEKKQTLAIRDQRRISSVSADKGFLESWYAKSIYASERFHNRAKRAARLQKSQESRMNIYHELTELPAISLPKITN